MIITVLAAESHGGRRNDKENLEAAIVGATSDFDEMYPGFIEEAETEEQTEARVSFWRANEVEKIHSELTKKVSTGIGQNIPVDYYVCQVCGNTVEN